MKFQSAPLCLAVGWLALSVTGCTDTEQADPGYQAYSEAEEREFAPDVVGHAAPNGGHLLEVGNSHAYHAEVTFDTESRAMTLYFYDSDAKTPLPIPTEDIEFELEEGDDEKVVALVAEPRGGEDTSIASRFVAAAAQFPETVKDIEDLHGHMHVTIDGTEYHVNLEHNHEHTHGHDEHGHAEHGDHKHGDDN